MGNSHKHFPLGLLLPCLLTVCLATPKTNITTDQSALLALKAHITHDPYQILEKNWTVGSPVCDWIGVTCGLRHLRVTALNLSYLDLTGTIPPQLGNLSFLVSLDMRANKFLGKLPNEFSQLRRLKSLILGTNNLSGKFPPWIGFLHELEYLFLNNNSFTGLIPPSISNLSRLAKLNLAFNSLQENVPVELFNISSLEKISLAYNSLSRSLTDSIFQNLQRLNWLSLSSNKLNGPIPSSIGQCLQLQIISLSYNKLTGAIPKSIGNLRALVLLALGANQLEGTIPKTIANLTFLDSLDSGMNDLTGEIPKEIGKLKALEVLYLDGNKLEGAVPRTIGNLTNLKKLHFSNNQLTGVIPREVSNLYNIEDLAFGQNKLTGSIPTELFNLSTIRVFEGEENQLFGSLPSTMGYGLPNLEEIYLGGNNIGGLIPYSISNCSMLWLIDFPSNKFTGPIPIFLGDLTQLEVLNLEENNLTNDSTFLTIITSLTNCKNLRELRLAFNPLKGTLPYSVGNLSTSLEWLELFNCQLRGTIPSGIGNLSSLISLYLNDNMLTGPLPSAITSLQSVQEIDLNRNRIRNSLHFFCACKNLEKLALQENNILASIPDCIGNITSMRYLYLGSNQLNSSLPENLWNLKDLLVLNLSSNLLSGSLPQEIGNLKMASKIDLSGNNFEGGIPSTMGDMLNLLYLSLAHNRLQGSIPETVGKMFSLERLDLSYNFLSGSLPISLEALQYLTSFNVSFNNFSGEIPSKGPFRNFDAESFISNDGLCGDQRFHVPPGPSISAHKVRTNKVHVLVLVLVGVIIVVGSMSFVFVCLLYKRKAKPCVQEDLSLVSQERISYYELVRATDGYNESNLLGTGGFGSIYKGTLGDGRIIAVKVFNLQIEGSFKSFDTECDVLRNLRHRNLTKVISSCSNLEFKALVLEYMPNGSLEKWLYSHNYFLNIMQRLDILIDVACALQYLHCENSTPIVHCDLKPSNVLLDQAMVAHVSDFGIAKLLGHEDSITYTKTLATLGYLAPEYGLEGLVSTKCDVYSFGILMMEVFTRMRPNNEMFGENLNLRSWVQDSLPIGLDHVIDVNLLRETKEECIPEIMVCVSSIMEVALTCTKKTPRERSNIQFILTALNKIKLQLQSHKEGLEGPENRFPASPIKI